MARGRGRPIGWRKPRALRFVVFSRVSKNAKRWVQSEAKRAGLTASDILRQLIDQRRKRDD